MNDKEFLSNFILYKKSKKRTYGKIIGYGVTFNDGLVKILDVNFATVKIMTIDEFINWTLLYNVTIQRPIEEWGDEDEEADKRLEEYNKRLEERELISSIIELLNKLSDKL